MASTISAGTSAGTAIAITGDTTGNLAFQTSAGTYTQTMPNGTGNIVVNGVNSAINSGTAVASTSGTSIDFTSIPSWVKRVTVMIAGMSTNGASEFVLRIGDSATISSTGYVGAYAVNASALASTTGFGFANGSSTTATIVSGSFVLTALDVATFKWTCVGMLGQSDTVRMTYSAGSKTLAGALTNVRITTINGTDTFDAGSINILYE